MGVKCAIDIRKDITDNVYSKLKSDLGKLEDNFAYLNKNASKNTSIFLNKVNNINRLYKEKIINYTPAKSLDLPAYINITPSSILTEKYLKAYNESEASGVQQEDAKRAGQEYDTDYLFQSLIDPNKTTSIFEPMEKPTSRKMAVADVEGVELNYKITTVLFNGIIKDTTATEVLRNIKASRININPEFRMIMSKLIQSKAKVKFVESSTLTNADTYMQYDTQTNTIQVAQDKLHLVNNEDVAVAKFMHEVLHSITFSGLNTPNTSKKKALATSLNKSFNETKMAAEERFSHQLSSIDEFVAAVFEDEEFKEFLKGEGFWNNIVNAIKRFFGFETKFDKLIRDIIELSDVDSPPSNFKTVLESKTDFELKNWDDLMAIQSEVVVPNEIDNFYTVRGEKFNRATRYLGQGATNVTKKMELSAKIGNEIDAMSKSVFSGTTYTFPESSKIIKSADFTKITKSLKKIKSDIEAESPGVVFLTDLYTIDKNNKVMGEADIVAHYPNGDIRVIDMKSIFSGLRYYDSAKGYESYRSKHTRQTNLYSNLIGNVGKNTLPPYIIAVQPYYVESDKRVQHFLPIDKDENYATLIKLERNEDVLTSTDPIVQAKIDKAQKNHEDWIDTIEYQEDVEVVNLAKLDNLARKLMDNVKSYVNISKHATKKDQENEYLEKLETLHASMLKTLQKDVTELNTLHYVKVISEFLEYSNDFFRKTERRFKQINSNNYYDYDEYTDLYRKSSSYVESFEIIDELKQITLELNNYGTIDNDTMAELDVAFDKVSVKKDKVIINLKNLSKNILEKVLTSPKYNKKIEIEYRDKYSREFEKKHGSSSFFRNKKTKEFEAAKRDYVTNQIAANRTEIEKATRRYVKEILDNPTLDISSTTFSIISDPNINNAFVQMFHQIAMEAHDTYKIEVGVKMQELDNKQAELGLKKKDFLKITQTDKDGNFFLRSQYKMEFYETYRKMQYEANKIEDPLDKKAAEKKLFAWLKANTKKKKENGLYAPLDKWKNNLSDLNPKQKEALKIFEEITELSEEYTGGRKSLIKRTSKYSKATYMQLPGILATTYANAVEGKLGEAVAKAVRESAIIEKDDVEEGASISKTGRKDVFRVYTDVAGNPIDTLVINYRNKVGDKQNLDLFTVYAMELENGIRFKNNYKIETTSLIFKDFIKHKKFINTKGLSKKKQLSIFKDPELEDYDTLTGEASNTFKKLDSMIKNRVYNVTNVYAGSISKVDANRAVATLVQYSSMLGMALHLPNAANNLANGTLAAFVDSIGSDIYSKENITQAFAFYNKNIPGLMADIGKPLPKNIINQLIQRFDVMGEYSNLRNQFERNNKVKQLLKADSLTGLHGMGEHGMHSIVMLAILNSVKVTNKDSKWISKEGKVVQSSKEAASLLDMFYTDEKGILRNKEIGYTSFDVMNEWENGGSVSIKGLIKDKIYKTQGAYDASMNAHWQRFWYGKLVMHFKKFFLSLFLNRFRGFENVGTASENLTDEQLYYNYNTLQKEMGYYTTFFRTLSETIKQHRFNMLQYRGAYANQWADMSDHERANMRKATFELSMVVLMGTLAAMLAGAAGDADDDTLWFFAYLAKRQQNEILQFMDPTEAWRIIKNPIASIRQLETITNSVGLLFSPFDWGEVYESGDNKGKSKVLTKFLRTVQPSVFRFDAQRMYNFYDMN